MMAAAGVAATVRKGQFALKLPVWHAMRRPIALAVSAGLTAAGEVVELVRESKFATGNHSSVSTNQTTANQLAPVSALNAAPTAAVASAAPVPKRPCANLAVSSAKANVTPFAMASSAAPTAVAGFVVNVMTARFATLEFVC